MIDSKKVEEAVNFVEPSNDDLSRCSDYVQTYIGALQELIPIGRAVLAVSKEMPEKTKCHNNYTESCGGCIKNKIIEECTLVATRLLAEKDELYDELSRSAALGLDKKDAEIERLKKEIEELKEENRILQLRLSNFIHNKTL